MEKEKRANYIIIPNSVFNDVDETRNITIDELYLYAWLYRNRILYSNDGWLTRTNIDLISKYCITFANGDESRNKRKIKEMLIKLSDKEYVCDADGMSIDEKLKNSEGMELQFTLASNKGYNDNIHYDTFDRFQSPLEFFIYAYIDCFGTNGRTISDYKWSRVAKRSETTMKEAIKKMNAYEFKPRIWKFSGDYYLNEYNHVRQYENTYYTRPDEEIIKKWNGFYAKNESRRERLVGFGSTADEVF